MTKIIRTKTSAEGGITAAEKRQMDAITQEWIGIAMRTDPIDPAKITPAIHALYAAADLPAPDARAPFAPRSREAIAAWALTKTRRQLNALAVARDIPLFALAK